MVSKDESQLFCGLAQLAPGDLRYFPTHYAGGRVTLETANRNDVVFVAQGAGVKPTTRTALAALAEATQR